MHLSFYRSCWPKGATMWCSQVACRWSSSCFIRVPVRCVHPRAWSWLVVIPNIAINREKLAILLQPYTIRTSYLIRIRTWYATNLSASTMTCSKISQMIQCIMHHVCVPQATAVRWYPNLFRFLLSLPDAEVLSVSRLVFNVGEFIACVDCAGCVSSVGSETIWQQDTVIITAQVDHDARVAGGVDVQFHQPVITIGPVFLDSTLKNVADCSLLYDDWNCPQHCFLRRWSILVDWYIRYATVLMRMKNPRERIIGKSPRSSRWDLKYQVRCPARLEQKKWWRKLKQLDSLTLRHQETHSGPRYLGRQEAGRSPVAKKI